MRAQDIMLGVNQFLAVISDLESDVPKIANWFTHLFLFPLFNTKEKSLDATSISWPEPNDETYTFDALFKVAAEVLLFQNKT